MRDGDDAQPRRAALEPELDAVAGLHFVRGLGGAVVHERRTGVADRLGGAALAHDARSFQEEVEAHGRRCVGVGVFGTVGASGIAGVTTRTRSLPRTWSPPNSVASNCGVHSPSGRSSSETRNWYTRSAMPSPLTSAGLPSRVRRYGTGEAPANVTTAPSSRVASKPMPDSTATGMSASEPCVMTSDGAFGHTSTRTRCTAGSRTAPALVSRPTKRLN